MVNVNKLKGKLIEHGYTQKSISEELNITPKTFYNRLQKGIFNSDEIEKLVELLELDDPMEIFFAK